jgi:hypothetical protein
MSTRKLYAFIATTLIAGAGSAGVAVYTNAKVGTTANAAVPATVQNIRTLPAITVRPSREELRRALGPDAGRDSGSAGGSDVGMPYYSFAADRHAGSP